MSQDRVNDLLHTLRGEQFRHAQNLRRSRAHVSATIARTLPSLPIDLDSYSYFPPPKPSPPPSAYKNTPGPLPPKSWTLTKQPIQVPSNTPPWRARALSLVVPLQTPKVPTLASLCLRILAALPPQEFAEDIVPWLAPHLRRDLIRLSAVHAPLPGPKLWPLYDPDGHADTEVLVVGPHATLRDDYFIRSSGSAATTTASDSDDDWDADKPGAEPLSTLILMSTRLATSTLHSLPPTLTRLALLNLSMPVPLHRLPNTCPLLVLLDLSYNTWLTTEDETDRAFERVDWARWGALRVLGLRECAMSSMVRVRLNKGRWDDVEVVLQ
ncbi:hypothetical protein DXG01_017133 [Tephrocybe rancida]|nr:hypothetical protein DXG01_017133 [Tephrocybe rancida]